MPSNERIAEYSTKASSMGISEIAITEHLFRFKQSLPLLDSVVAGESDAEMADSMKAYFHFHATMDLDQYVESIQSAKDAGLPVRLGLEVDYYRGSMDEVSAMLSGYPFDVILGSVHWLGTWRFDDLDDTLSMGRWSAVSLDEAWMEYEEAMKELTETAACDVIAHPDLIKVHGEKPPMNSEFWSTMADILSKSGMAAEVSSAGWRKPVGEQYPAAELIAELARRAVPFTTASDAHTLSLVGDQMGRLRTMLADTGVTSVRGFSARVARDIDIHQGSVTESA